VAKRYTSKKDRATLFLRQNGRCNGKGCDTKLVPGNYIIEHVQPLSRGGTDTLDNKALRCKACADKKTLHPRSKASTIGGDTFEFWKTKRMAGETCQPTGQGLRLRSRGFRKDLTRRFDGTVVPRK
jgi:hypothetical protein